MGKGSKSGDGRNGGLRTSGANSASGIGYVKSASAVRSGDVAVKVSVSKLEQAWARDTISHIPKNGSRNTIGDRYANAKAFIKDNQTGVRMPEIAVTKTGSVIIRDGRHRTAAIRDSGKKSMYVTVSKGSAAKVRKLLGDD